MNPITIGAYQIRSALKRETRYGTTKDTHLYVIKLEDGVETLIRRFQCLNTAEALQRAEQEARELIEDLNLQDRPVKLKEVDEYQRHQGLQEGMVGAVVELRRFKHRKKKHLKLLVEVNGVRSWFDRDEVEPVQAGHGLHIPVSVWKDATGEMLPRDKWVLVAYGPENATAGIKWDDHDQRWRLWYSTMPFGGELLAQVHHYLETNLSPNFFTDEVQP
jgi:hypothetical protein